MKRHLIVAIVSSFLLIACGGDSDSSGSNKQVTPPTKPTPSTPPPTKPQPPVKPALPVPSNPKPPVTAQPSIKKAWLDSHNAFRRRHQVGDLKWSDTLEKSAQAFVDTCPSSHSGSRYGENMAFASYKQTPQDVVQRWYSEEPRYNYNYPNFSAGHFSQIVWKSTTEVGCAQASHCSNGWSDVVVCQYNPAGNYGGRYKDNVFPPK